MSALVSVSNLILSVYQKILDQPFLNMFFEMVVAYVDVLGMWAESWK